MELALGATYQLEDQDQFWSELSSIISISSLSPLSRLDYSLLSYLHFVSTYRDEFLHTSEDEDRVVEALIKSEMFLDHPDRMVNLVLGEVLKWGTEVEPGKTSEMLEVGGSNIQQLPSPLLQPQRSPTYLILPLQLLLRLGKLNSPSNDQFPSIPSNFFPSDPSTSKSPSFSTYQLEYPRTSTPVFLRLRNEWNEVVNCLIEFAERCYKRVVDVGREEDGAKVVEESSDDEEEESVNGEEETREERRRERKEERKRRKTEGERRVAGLAVELLYDVCRVARSRIEELDVFTEQFIEHLFELVEITRFMEDESFNYSLIRLIIALNEQFMVASLPETNVTSDQQQSHHHSHSKRNKIAEKKNEDINVVMKVLKAKMGASKTFGENMIWILNRSSTGDSPEDLCVSLLILKILYLLFTTPSTSEYFYTNDLHVLLDIFIRTLSNLSEENEGLRHTYLRVLSPLMSNTQLRERPYKRGEIWGLLRGMVDGKWGRTASSTTKRLVERNLKGDWCKELEALGRNNGVGRSDSGLSVGSLGSSGSQYLKKERSASADEVGPQNLGSPVMLINRAQIDDAILEVAENEKDKENLRKLRLAKSTGHLPSSPGIEKKVGISLREGTGSSLSVNIPETKLGVAVGEDENRDNRGGRPRRQSTIDSEYSNPSPYMSNETLLSPPPLFHRLMNEGGTPSPLSATFSQSAPSTPPQNFTENWASEGEKMRISSKTPDPGMLGGSNGGTAAKRRPAPKIPERKRSPAINPSSPSTINIELNNQDGMTSSVSALNISGGRFGLTKKVNGSAVESVKATRRKAPSPPRWKRRGEKEAAGS